MNKLLITVFFFAFCCVGLFAQQTEWRDFIEKKQFEKVISDAGDLQPSDSTDFTKMYLIGQAYEGLLRYKEAYHCYKQCYLLDSARIDVLNTLARMAVSLGRTKEAETYYLAVLASDSENFFANYQLARLYVSIESYGQGLYYYGILLENDPENAVILRAIGDCFTQLQLLGTALEFYQAAYRANVENASLASTLVNTLLKLNNPSINNYAAEALSICDTALYYNAGNKTLRQNRAMTYFVLEEYLKADTLYTELLADRDSSYNTLKYCGCARYYAQHWYDAIEPLEKAFEMDPTALEVCILLGNALGRTYDPNQALEYFDKAESLMAPHPYWQEKLIQFRADVYLKKNELNRAAELYYQLWKQNEEKLIWLQHIQRAYVIRSNAEVSDDFRQRSLFISYLYASELLKSQKTPKTPEMSREFSYIHSALQKFEEEMFFRSVESLPMTSPDNRRSTLSREKLKELTNQLAAN